MNVGVITYDLQPFTEDCLYRISQALPEFTLTAYPVFAHPNQGNARIPAVYSSVVGRFFGVKVTGSTPEGFASNVNLRAAWRCVLDNEIVVLFGLQGGSALVAAFLATLFARRLISVNQTLPLEWEKRRRWWVRSLKTWLLQRCHLHIYQTSVSHDVLTEVYRVPESSLISAPFEAGARLFQKHLMDLPRATGAIRAAYHIESKTVLFAFIGNLHPFKGVVDLLHAISEVPRGLDLCCLFVGREEPRNKEGATISHYSALASKLQCADRVRFVGEKTVEELCKIYAEVDVVILPTHKDCFPKVLVEAALASKPIVTTTACGAAGSLVVHGDNGLVVRPGDQVALAEAMASLCKEHDLTKMGCRSREIVGRLCDARLETAGYVEAIRRAANDMKQ